MNIAMDQGQTTPRGQNFVVNRNLLSLQSFAMSFKKSLLTLVFIHIFFMILYMYVPPWQGQITPWGHNFGVHRNILSLRPFVTSLKKVFLKSDIVHIFSRFYNAACSHRAGADNSLGTKF